MIVYRSSDLTVIDDKGTWDRVLNEFSLTDVYYTYEYCEWNAVEENGQAKLVYFENHLGKVIYPFIVRTIINYKAQPLYDITTPYGYGGPLISGDEKVLDEFTRRFQQYCIDTDIVSEIVRLHPLINNAGYLSNYLNLNYIRKTTAVDLSGELTEIKQNYSKMTKRNIKKALSNDLYCVEVIKSNENIKTFMELYDSTMERKNARDSYYFDFNSFKKQLFDTELAKSHLLFVYSGKKAIAASILYTTPYYAHYHLGASDKEYLELRPNNLLFDFMVELSKDLNCKLLHLGGGYQESDSLFKYKASFTNDNNYEYLLGTNIYNQRVYDELVEIAANQSELRKNYFPLYRGI